MKIRSLTHIVLGSALILTLTANSAFAGGRHKERWEGIAIGLGAAILGSAILSSNNHSSDRVPERCPLPAPVYKRHNTHHKGYWEVRAEWIPPIHKKVWNPGHYNRKGKWIEGAWIEIMVKPGYWTERKVWVTADASRHRRSY